jgi:hypothetical protein
MALSGRRWNAATAASSCLATALTGAGLTGRPRPGRSAIATLRVESPSTKHARIMRSTAFARRAEARTTWSALKVRVRGAASSMAPSSVNPAAIAAVAPVGLAELGHALEVLIDQLVHAAFEQPGERVAGTGAIVLAPFHAIGLHGLHHGKGNR